MGLGGKATSRKHVNRTDLERSSIQAIRVAHFLLARVLYADPRDVCHHALTSALTSQVSLTTPRTQLTMLPCFQ